MKAILASRPNDIVRQQAIWIEELEKVSIKPVWLAYTNMDGTTPSKRVLASQYPWTRPYQYRECLHNEIPYDLDVDDWFFLRLLAQPTIDFLKSENIPHLVAGSGGSKSVHIHIWFKPPWQVVQYGWRAIRIALWDWILDQANIPEQSRGVIMSNGRNFPYDTSVCNFSDMAHAKVMRDFGGKARGKKPKTLILGDLPETREEVYREYILMPDTDIQLWDVSKIIDELNLDGYGPPSCRECPVVIEKVLRNYPDGLNQYPEICRKCRKVYEI